MKVSIIGAGPVGSFMAYLLAPYFEVHVFEEHNNIGMPIQCTGILTHEISKILEVPEKVIANKISTYEIHGGKEKLIINLSEPDIIVDRDKFDNFLARKAQERGAIFHTRHKLVEISEGKLKFESEGKFVEKEKDILIGADGANSIVSRHLGNTNDYYMGIQAVVELERQAIEVFAGKGKFGWVVPEKKGLCRVGIMEEREKAKEVFDEFVKGHKIVKMQAGIIPKFNPKNVLCKNNVYIVGDSAGMVKATTGGGIIQGLRAAQKLAVCIIGKKDYEKEIKEIKKELALHLRIRNALDKFSERNLEKIIKVLSKEKNKKLLESISRDSLAKLAVKLVISEPRLLLYGRKLL